MDRLRWPARIRLVVVALLLGAALWGLRAERAGSAPPLVERLGPEATAAAAPGVTARTTWAAPHREPCSGSPTTSPDGGVARPGETTTAVVRAAPVEEAVRVEEAATGNEEERAAAARLTGEMRRLARDLEFNAGLREPPQQVVLPAPEPWRPEPVETGLPPPAIDQVAPRSAPASGGAQVVLRGRNLRPVSVMFGTQAARITRASEEAVTVEVPRGQAGPATIALTNDDGSYAMAGVPFTYRPQ
jgi:hypothetical protein